MWVEAKRPPPPGLGVIVKIKKKETKAVTKVIGYISDYHGIPIWKTKTYGREHVHINTQKYDVVSWTLLP